MAMIFRKVKRSKWRIPLVVHLLFGFLGACGGASAVAQQRALIDGVIRTGKLTGKSPNTLVFETKSTEAESKDEKTSLTAIRQINFGARPRLVSGIFPPRLIDFRGGESLHAGIETVDSIAIGASLFGAASSSVPRAAVARLLHPAGERSLVYEDFENRPTLFEVARLSPAQHRSGRLSLSRRPGDGPVALLVGRSISTGRIELSFYDTGAVDRSQDWFIEIELGAREDAVKIRFSLGWSAPEYRCATSGDARLAAQSVARSKGWHRFALLFDPQRLVALVDDKVIGTGAGAGAPTAIRILNAAVDGADKARVGAVAKTSDENQATEGWIDDLQIFEHVETLTPPTNTQPIDLAWLATGDELFGAVLTSGPREVMLSGKSGQRRIPWSELNGIVFAAGGAPAGAPVDGVIATIELAPILGADVGTNDRIVAALQQVSESELIAAHPCLGTVHIPLREVERIVPQFSGSLRLIDPAHHHLGNEIREDFSAKLAEGPRLERSFTLESVPKPGLHVSLLAADIEPALSQDERFRRQLSAGHLRTELLVNGRRVTDLNKLVSWRSKPDNPQRLRIAVPAAFLKKGANILRLEQSPTMDDPQEFDDCEISRLAIEIDAVTR